MGPKLRKAARGKHRWIGLRCPIDITTIEEMEQLLILNLGEGVVKKILDFGAPVPHTCILKVGLSDYALTRAALVEDSESALESLTSSGKLKLVRQRLAEDF